MVAVLSLALAAHAGNIVVNTTADDGPGSLRQAILDANAGLCAAPCLITFAPTPGVITIEPLSPLPDITGTGIRIAPDPPARGWTVEISGRKLTSGDGIRFRGSNGGIQAMIINGFPGSGIVFENAVNSGAGYNFIGLDAKGLRPVPNQQNGITVIGGHDISLSSNRIGGNRGDGINVTGTRTLGFGLNGIGDVTSGSLPLPNGGHGVFLSDVNDAWFLRGCDCQ